jgi:type I restriction enzyme, S subunit
MTNTVITPLGSPLPAEWTLRPLGEMCVKIGSGATPKGGSAVYLPNGVSFIRSQNVLDHRFSRAGLAYIGPAEAAKLSSVEVQERDVLLNITGDGETIARCCIAPATVLPARVNQHVMIIRVKDGIVPEFLQRYLSHPLMRAYMLSHNSGGSRRALTKGQVERFLISTPPLRTQHAIAAILGALDDKIAVNERISATSADLARSIYQAAVREAHKISPIGTSMTFKYGKALKESNRRAGEIPVFGCTGQVGWHDTALTRGPIVVVGRKGANAGWVSWSPEPCWVIDTAYFVETEDSKITPEVAFLMLESANLPSLVGDSAVPGLNREAAHAHLVPMLATDAIHTVTVHARPLMSRAAQTKKESRTLNSLRDTLLPQLMAGQLRVRDAERIAEDAV